MPRSGPESAHLVALLVPALWLGFVLAISFLEAPIKFRAPGVTRDAALSIGRLVFRALARVELCLWLLEGIALWLAGWPAEARVWFAGLGLVVALQQAWLLPRLNRRAEAVLGGDPVPPDRRLHGLYVGMECVKIALLAILSFALTARVAVAGP
jgi:hypothetical protein